MNAYPPDWSEIATAVKDAAGWHCENCGHPNNRDTGHMLTVHHLDRDPSNCDPRNLVALCQRCHLSIQAKYKAGQLTLPIITRPEWMITRDLARVPELA